MKTPVKYKIVIIEPSELIREGIKLFLEKNPHFQVSAGFSDLQSFEKKVFREDFQAILFNPATAKFYQQINVRDLFAAYPDVCLVAIMYQYADEGTLRYFDGVMDIYGQGSSIPQKLLNIMEAAGQKTEPPAESVELSGREKDTLIALARGLSNKEIADKLHISTHTVVSHRKNIVRKTGVKTVSGLTLYALFNNLISQDDL